MEQENMKNTQRMGEKGKVDEKITQRLYNSYVLYMAKSSLVQNKIMAIQNLIIIVINLTNLILIFFILPYIKHVFNNTFSNQDFSRLLTAIHIPSSLSLLFPVMGQPNRRERKIIFRIILEIGSMKIGQRRRCKRRRTGRKGGLEGKKRWEGNGRCIFGMFKFKRKIKRELRYNGGRGQLQKKKLIESEAHKAFKYNFGIANIETISNHFWQGFLANKFGVFQNQILNFLAFMDANNSKKIKRAINGRWNRSQQERFMKGLEKHGRDWVKVQKVVRTRTVTQIRSHAQKYFLKMDKRDIEALIAGDDYSESEQESEEIISYKYNQLRKKRKDTKLDPQSPHHLSSISPESHKKNIIEESAEKNCLPQTNHHTLQLPSPNIISSLILSNDMGQFMKYYLKNIDYFKGGGNFIDMIAEEGGMVGETPQKPIQFNQNEMGTTSY